MKKIAFSLIVTLSSFTIQAMNPADVDKVTRYESKKLILYRTFFNNNKADLACTHDKKSNERSAVLTKEGAKHDFVISQLDDAWFEKLEEIYKQQQCPENITINSRK